MKGDPSGHIHALLAELQLLDAQRAQPQAAIKVVAAQRVAAVTAHRLATALIQQVRAQQVAAQSTRRLAAVAIAAYANPQASFDAQRQAMSAAQAAVVAAQRKATAAQTDHNRAQAALEAAQRAQYEAPGLVAGARFNLAVVVAHQNDNGPHSWSLSIMGKSAFTGPELAKWFKSTDRSSHAKAPIEKIAGWYVSEGHDEGVQGDMAFMQAIIETGSFSSADTVKFNNFAGIGHCDNCAAGFNFATPQLGVRAQIQLLKSYARARPVYKHPLVDPRLRGPAGCCETWRALTRTWATDPIYGQTILNQYRAGLRWLIVQRHGTIPRGD